MIVAIAGLGTLSTAQDKADFREEAHFGLKGGVNFSNVYDSEGEDFEAETKMGLAGGVFLAIPLGKYFGVQPEVLFSQRGFQATGQLLGSPYNFTRTSSYLDVPLLFAIKPSEFVTLVVGPQYSYLLKQKDEFANGGSSVAQEQEFKNDNVRRNILCFTGGLDINIEHFVIALRAGWDVQKNNGDGSSSTPRYKNAWYQAAVGFRF